MSALRSPAKCHHIQCSTRRPVHCEQGGSAPRIEVSNGTGTAHDGIGTKATVNRPKVAEQGMKHVVGSALTLRMKQQRCRIRAACSGPGPAEDNSAFCPIPRRESLDYEVSSVSSGVESRHRVSHFGDVTSRVRGPRMFQLLYGRAGKHEKSSITAESSHRSQMSRFRRRRADPIRLESSSVSADSVPGFRVAGIRAICSRFIPPRSVERLPGWPARRRPIHRRDRRPGRQFGRRHSSSRAIRRRRRASTVAVRPSRQ